jgi:anti-sigma B factor antagonist
MRRVNSKTVGDIVVLYPKGMYTGGDETDALKITMGELFEDGARKMVVNLHDVSYLNSTALGVLLEAREGLAKHRGRIILTNVQDRINAIFLETKLILVFDTFDTEKEAIQELQGVSSAKGD